MILDCKWYLLIQDVNYVGSKFRYADFFLDTIRIFANNLTFHGTPLLVYVNKAHEANAKMFERSSSKVESLVFSFVVYLKTRGLFLVQNEAEH